jgi:hypothetical protein
LTRPHDAKIQTNMTSANAPEVNTIITSFTNKIPKIQGAPDFSSLSELKQLLGTNAAEKDTTSGGGANGYLGLILTAASTTPSHLVHLSLHLSSLVINPLFLLEPLLPKLPKLSICTLNSCANGRNAEMLMPRSRNNLSIPLMRSTSNHSGIV